MDMSNQDSQGQIRWNLVLVPEFCRKLGHVPCGNLICNFIKTVFCYMTGSVRILITIKGKAFNAHSCNSINEKIFILSKESTELRTRELVSSSVKYLLNQKRSLTS